MDMFLELKLRGSRSERTLKMALESLSKNLPRLFCSYEKEAWTDKRIRAAEEAANRLFDAYERLSAAFGKDDPAPEGSGEPYICGARVIIADEAELRGHSQAAYIHLDGMKMGTWFIAGNKK